MTSDMGSGLNLSVRTCLSGIESDFVLDEDIAANGRIAEIEISDGVGGRIHIIGGTRTTEDILAEAREEAENFSCMDSPVRWFQKSIRHTVDGEPYTLYYICIDYN